MRPTLVLLAVLSLVVLVAVIASPARAAEKGTVGLRYPSLTPDNQQVVFAYRGDIWVAPVDGSRSPRRLTIHEAQDTLPRVSPDGKTVAFISRRNGSYDVYRVGIDGGMPTRVTFHSAGEVLCDWSHDGKRLLIMTARHPSLNGLDLYEVDLAGGTPRRVTRDGGREGVYVPGEPRVVYVRGFNTVHQDNYRGSANYDIYVVDGPGALPRQLTETLGNERYPFVSKDGQTIWFVAEEKGIANVFAMPLEGGKRRQVTHFEEDVWRPRLAWDGKTLVFERAGRLFMTDLTTEKPEAKPIPVLVESDVRHSGIEVRRITTGPEQVDVSPGGDRLAFSVHGDIWVMPASGGEGRRITSGKAKDEWPRWHPNGRAIAYQSDAGDDSNIWLLDLETKEKRQLTKHKAHDFYHDWSPNGEKLVFCSERSGNRDLWTLELDSGRLEQLTTHSAGDDDPNYSPDGKWIAFDSAREGSQAIFVIPAQGGDARRVTQDRGFLQVPSWSPDGSMLVYESFNPTNGSSNGLFVISAGGGPSVPISRNGAAACWSPKGDYIFYTVRRNGSTEISRIPAPTSVDPSARVPFVGRIEVDRRTELGDLFDEAWERLKEGFYDPKMHGVDWDKMKEKYRPMAVDAEIKAEFQNVIRQMLAELGASHLGIEGGQEPVHVVRSKTETGGHLGLEFESEPLPSGGRRVLHVLAGGPADKVGLRVGDVVVKIGRTTLKPSTNVDRVLTGTVDKEIPIVYRPATTDGLGNERMATIEPVAWRAVATQNYRNWVARCAKLVKEKTKGRIGYIHLDMMNGANLQRFRQAVARWNRDRRNRGMILDVRYNGGGNIHVPLLEILTARPLMQFQPRGAPRKTRQPELYWGKPIVVLTNERSFSDAEVFPDGFKTAKLGKIVGVPTPGGVIGTTNVTLSDGSTLRIPRVGYYSMDNRRLEGRGVTPDVIVRDTPASRREGRDPQLEKAIEVVLEEVAAKQKPPRKPTEAPKPSPEKPPERPTPPDEPPRPSPPAAEAGPAHPLADAEPGEWVRYRFSFGGATTVLRYEVTEVFDDFVHFRLDVERGGEFLPPLPEETPREPLLDILPALGPVRGHTEGTGRVGEVEAPLLTLKIEWQDTPVQVVFTNVVPALGLLRAEVEGRVVLEAVAWGSGTPPAAERSPVQAVPTRGDGAADAAPDVVATEGKPVVENPLRDASVGEWIRFRARSGDEEAIVTMEVVEVDEEEVVLRSTVEQDGETSEGPEIRRPRTATLPMRARQARVEISHGTVTVGERTLECTVLRTRNRRGMVLERWFCPEVSVTGLVRVVRDGRVIQEVLEWGRDG